MGQERTNIEIITRRPKLLADASQTVDMLVRITPKAADEKAPERPKLNLSIVLDRSGSMNGNKLQEAKEACKYCIDQLLSQDRIGAVMFDNEVAELFDNQPVRAEGKPGLKWLFDSVYAGGATALHAAWHRGGVQLSSHIQNSAINRILLITDGQANEGITDTPTIISHTAGLAERSISTSTIGIGRDFNEELLVPMAEAGRGNAWHVAEPGDIQRIFEVELSGLIAQVGHNATLAIAPKSGVEVIEVLNDLERDESGRIKLPNLTADSPLDIVVRLSVDGSAAGTSRDLADISLSYSSPIDGSVTNISSLWIVEFAGEAEVNDLPEDRSVVTAIHLLTNARLRMKMIHDIDIGDGAAARENVSNMRINMCLAYEEAPSPEFQRELESLRKLEKTLENDVVAARKLGRYSSYARSRGRD
jgi:Ca-activated chloride channel homolog